MKLPVAILISLYVFALPTSHAQTNAARTGVSPTASAQESHLISIMRSGSRQPSKGPSERFTGTVQIEPLFSAHDPSRVIGGSVTFQTGARTAWHTHPLGQILIVTAGVGLGCAMGRSGPRDSRRRRRLDSSRSETLAWSDSEYSNDSYRNIGRAQRQQWRVVGKGKRRTIQEVSLIHALKRGV